MTFLVEQHIEPGGNILTHSVLLFVCLLFLYVSVALTVINTFWSILFVLHIGRINPGTYGVALTTCFTGLSEFSTTLPCSTWDSSLDSRSCLQSCGLSTSQFQISQFMVSEMLSGSLFPSQFAGWRSILQIRWTFNTWVSPPGRFFADKASGKRNLSNNLNAATLLY